MVEKWSSFLMSHWTSDLVYNSKGKLVTLIKWMFAVIWILDSEIVWLYKDD